MTDTDEWLEQVVHAGGHKERPPSPNIPTSYMPKASRAESLPDKNTPTVSPRKRKCSDPIDVGSAKYSPQKFGRYWEGSTESKRPRSILAEIEVPNMAQPRSPKQKGTQGGRNADNDVFTGASQPDLTLRQTRRKNRIPVIVSDKTTFPRGPASNRSGLASVEDVDSQTYADSLIDESAESKNSKRSVSPTKRMVDLRVLQKRIIEKGVTSLTDLPSDVRDLYSKIQTIGMTGSGIVPFEIKNEIEEACEGTEPFFPFMFASQASTMDQDQLLQELNQLTKIRNNTSFCISKKVHEPSWNERVHSRVLEQAVEHLSGMEYHNITTARVLGDLVPDNIYGEALKRKMVDYVITLSDPVITESDVSIRLGSSVGTLRRTINPSDYSPLCYDPIAVSVETKSPDGSEQEAKVQLSIWVTAHFNRLRDLLVRDVAQLPVSVTLPILFVSGESWTLSFARDRDKSIDIIGSILIGSTASILGGYKIITALRLLCQWCSTTYRDWFMENVLSPE